MQAQEEELIENAKKISSHFIMPKGGLFRRRNKKHAILPSVGLPRRKLRRAKTEAVAA